MAKALAIDPDARFQTAGEFQEGLMRLAHRAGLLMSAPELADELRDDCGPNDQWRDEEDDDDFGYAEAKRGGTEVYNGSDDDDDELVSEPQSISASSKPTRHSRPSRPSPSRPSQMRPKTELGKFAGKELTSIINMIDLEDAPPGSQPLVDLDSGSGPRLYRETPEPNEPPPRLLPTTRPPIPSHHTAQHPPTQHGHAPARAAVQARPPSAQRPAVAPPRITAQRVAAAPPTMRLPPSGFSPPGPHGYPAGMRPPENREMAPQSRRGTRNNLTPWIVFVAILFVAGIAALVVALSGPSVPGR
jgi:hypothetical protein